MNRKDYEAVADAIRSFTGDREAPMTTVQTKREIAEHMAYKLGLSGEARMLFTQRATGHKDTGHKDKEWQAQPPKSAHSVCQWGSMRARLARAE